MTVPAANVLIVIPRNQFAEDELFPLKEKLEAAGCRVWVLSRTGKEALGMNKTKFQPDGMLADWNKQEGVPGKYDAVIVTGGKGAPKTLWTDDLLPQMLTDHVRAGKIVAGTGLGIGSLAQANVLIGEASAGDHPELLQVLDNAAIADSGEPFTQTENVMTATGPDAASQLADAILSAF